MYVFTYPVLFRLLYRYGNIPASIILIFYVYLFASSIDVHIVNLIPLIFFVIILYFLNKQYLILYKILPFRIEADEEKLICSDFFLSHEKLIISYKDISELKGGVFEGRFSGVMKVFDSTRNAPIGFFPKIKNADKLEAIILRKVSRELYDSVVEKVKLISGGKPT